jgi:hypothetical protein
MMVSMANDYIQILRKEIAHGVHLTVNAKPGSDPGGQLTFVLLVVSEEHGIKPPRQSSITADEARLLLSTAWVSPWQPGPETTPVAPGFVFGDDPV